jgi:hypothetical protein
MLKTSMNNATFMPATPDRQAGCDSRSPMMRNRLVPRGVAVLLGLSAALCAHLFAPAPVHAQPRDPSVTSDTPEYCGVLMERITGMVRGTPASPSTEVAVLSLEGQRMCVHGQTHGGIMRLRRAIAIMRHEED